MAIGLGLLIMLAMSCGVMSLTHPPTLSKRVTEIAADQALTAPVEVIIDDRGIPHLFGEHETDLAYALGFMHARDRAFQIIVLLHAAQGRLTELFGEDLLELDQTYRLLTYRLDEQVEVLPQRDRTLMQRYLDGLNLGALHAGPSAEMRLLGLTWTPLELRDIASMMRLQGWGLSRDMRGELQKSRILARLPEGDTRRAALLQPVPTGGVPILFRAAAASAGASDQGRDGGTLLTPDLDGGVRLLPLPLPSPSDAGDLLPLESIMPLLPPESQRSPVGDAGTLGWLSDPASPLSSETLSSETLSSETLSSETLPSETLGMTRERARARALHFVRTLGLEQHGASNSWVVAGAHTESGAPMLSNDPHLRHLLPSMFYLVHLENKAMRAVGASFPGIPAVVIGHTRHLAWGMTTSYIDTQDLIRIELDPNDDGRYLIAGRPHRFGRWRQRFEHDGEILRTQIWRTTLFGPVLESAWDHLTEPGVAHALMWTGFDPALNKTSVAGFWDLYIARNLKQARTALDRVGSPSQNVTLAFQDGTIAYHLMGAVPQRQSGAEIDRPREGRSLAAAWKGTLDHKAKPRLENPAAGYIVTANQRVTGKSGPFAIGRGGGTPHRAERIHALLRPLIKRGGIKLDEVLALQGDVVSIEAQRLVPILAGHCQAVLQAAEDEDNDLNRSSVDDYGVLTVARFCQALSDFDARFTTLSTGALVFVWLLDALQMEIAETHLGPDVALQLRGDPALVMAVEKALLDEHGLLNDGTLLRGDRAVLSPLLDDRRTPTREGGVGFVARAMTRTLERLDNEVGLDKDDWRWGRVHLLHPKSPLSRAPLIGSRFTLPWRPQSGQRHTVRAEGGTPIQHGAVLRFVAELTEPIQARFTLDFGQSGHMGHPHLADMRDDWDAIRPRAIPTEKSAIAVEAVLRLVPAAPSP